MRKIDDARCVVYELFFTSWIFILSVVEFLLLFNEFARYWMLVGGFIVRNLAGFG